MKKRNHFIILVLACFSLVGCTQSKEEDAVLAEVGEIVITKADFYEELKTTVGEDTLRQMTLERLLKEKYSVREKEIQHAINQIKTQQGFSRDDDLEKALKENGTTFDAFHKNIEMNLLLEKASIDGVRVSEEEVKAEYERVKTQVRASQILVEDRTLANDLYKQLQSGADFEKMAEKYSIDASSSINGGDLGFFGEDYFIDAIEKKAFSLNVGAISEPIETAYGFHILKVTDKNRTYEELKKTLKEDLAQQQKKTVDEVLTDLLQKKDVSIYDGTLKDALK